TVQGKEVPTFPISSYAKAREIASTLKQWVETGSFLLTNPVESLPGVDSGISLVTLDERTPEEMQ
ncbi:MAG: homocysteine biosynthesis protein, partial [Syntrophorhabdus sp.]